MMMMLMTTMRAVMMIIKQRQAAKHCNASEHKQPTTNKRTCLQACTTRLPGKQLDSKKQRHKEASVEPRHVHATIAILQRVDDSRDEERTRACGLPAPTSKYRSSSAAGGRTIQTATSSEEEELAREHCAGMQR
jgi:hypothetical protein